MTPDLLNELEGRYQRRTAGGGTDVNALESRYQAWLQRSSGAGPAMDVAGPAAQGAGGGADGSMPAPAANLPIDSGNARRAFSGAMPLVRPREQLPPVDLGQVARALRHADEPHGSFRAAKPAEGQAADRWYTNLVRDDTLAAEEPWFNPFDAAAAGFGAGAKVAAKVALKTPVKAALKMLAPKAVMRGATASIPAALMDLPIGTLAELADADENTALAFMTAIGAGLVSGATIEPMIDNKLYALATRVARRYGDNPRIAAIANRLGIGETAGEKAGRVFDRMKGAAMEQAGEAGKEGLEDLPNSRTINLGDIPGPEQMRGGPRVAPVRTGSGMTIREAMLPEPNAPGPAEQSAQVFRQALEQADRLRQSPRGGVLLRDLLARQEQAGIEDIVQRGRAFAQANPALTSQMGRTSEMAAVDPVLAENAVRRGKLDELAQRLRGRSLADLEDAQLIPEKMALQHDDREDLARLVQEEIDSRASRRRASREEKKEPRGETLRYAIQSMGGLDLLHFRGEGRDLPPMVRRSILRKGGMPIDLAETQLKEEGWLDQSEDLIELLRSDPEALRRRHPGHDITERTRNLTDSERRLKEGLAWEPDAPEDDPEFDALPFELQTQVAAGKMDMDAAKQASAAGSYGQVPFAMAGGAAGLEQDERGNVSFNPKKTLAGMAMGAAGIAGMQRIGRKAIAVNFIKTKAGKDSFGEITEEIGRKIKREAGKIRLSQHAVDHIASKRGRLRMIKQLGYDGVEDFVEDVASNYNKIYEGTGGGSLILAKRNGGNKVIYVELVPDKESGVYNVKSAIPYIRGTAFLNKKVLWDGAPSHRPDAQHLPPSAVSGQSTDKSISPDRHGSKQKRNLLLHPSTITGPIGGLASGVDWNAFWETGDVVVDPKKALVGAMAGAAGGTAIGPARRLGVAIAQHWDKNFAERIVNWARRTSNGLIVNEELRHGLGLNRSEAFQDMLRDHHRDIERAWNKAAEIGRELQRIAPTKLEQRRLMQVVRGGITVSKEMREKADQVNKLFAELREYLKKYQLLEYSRFDKLTRKERAKLRNIIAKSKASARMREEAFRQAYGIDPDPAPKHPAAFDPTRSDDAPEWATERIPLDAYAERPKTSAEWAREKLHDHYHFASAQEYAPIYYNQHEGLTPKQKETLRDEIDRLKVKSRRGNPEGKPELEAMIAELEQMLGEGSKEGKALSKGRKGLNRRYSHRRIEIPHDIQKILGKIEEAPFPVAKMAGIQQTDVIKQRLFKEISERSDWALPSRMKNPRTGEMMKVYHDPPANFVKVNNDRFGALDGMYVRKDIWDDLREIEEWRGVFVRNWDKLMGAWKYGKVVLNPATHARNTMSNVILAYLGDVNPADVKTYGKALKAVRQGENNAHFKEASDWGLFNNTFVSSEITRLRDELEGLRDVSSLKSWIRKAASLPAEMYEGNEKLFKMAVFIKAREGGATVDEAARKAEKFLFNYSDVPPWVKHMKRWVSPFFTFTYKAVPLFAEMTIRKPWKVGAIAGAMYGMEKFARHQLGMTDEEANTQRRMLPEWQQRRTLGIGPYNHVLMPFRDKWGNNLYLDMSYILPYGNLGEKWGQSALPLSDFLPSSPLFSLAAAYPTNKDPFTGRELYNEILDGTGEILAKYFDYAWKEFSPSLAPGGYGFNKLKTGIQNSFMGEDVRDWADRPVEFSTAALSALLGIKLSPANQKKLEQFELSIRRRIDSAVEQERNRLKSDYRRNKIDNEQYKEESKRLNQLKKQLLQERPKP